MFFVKRTLPSNKEPGTFRCSRKRCLTCPFVVSRTTVTGPKSTLNITEHFNCTTPNIIYCIQCSNCNKLYIGETGRRLGDHLFDIHKNDLSKPAFSLAILILHVILFLILLHSVFLSSTAAAIVVKLKKMELIHALGTLIPHEIIERFIFY